MNQQARNENVTKQLKKVGHYVRPMLMRGWSLYSFIVADLSVYLSSISAHWSHVRTRTVLRGHDLFWSCWVSAASMLRFFFRRFYVNWLFAQISESWDARIHLLQHWLARVTAVVGNADWPILACEECSKESKVTLSWPLTSKTSLMGTKAETGNIRYIPIFYFIELYK